MKIYNGLVHNSFDMDIVREVKPKYLMLSYFYWKKKSIKDVKEELGYNPHILLDSGAYSAKNKNIRIDIDKLIRYIKYNKNELDGYFNLDVIGDPKESYKNYMYMRLNGLKPIPVIHYNTDYISFLKQYMTFFPEVIGLGGAAKIDKKKVAEWVEKLKNHYEYQYFHILGKTCSDITDINIYSGDSTSWITDAINGRPENIKGKREKCLYNLKHYDFLSHITEITRRYEEEANE